MEQELDLSKYVSKSQKREMQSIDILILIIVSFYFSIDCITISYIQDQLGIHWLLLSILNFLSGVFMFQYRKDIFHFSIKPIFKNSILLIYFFFLIIAGVSIFFCN